MKTLALAALSLLAVPAVAAQSLPSWGAPPEDASSSAAEEPPALPNGGAEIQQVPIDGGLGLLALAGGVYAARRLRRRSA